MRCYITLVFCILAFYAKAEYPNLDSLYANSDIVLSGRIADISSDYFTDDLGTEIYTVFLHTDNVYKQNYPIDPKRTKIAWAISNLRCRLNPLSDCILKYKTGKWIFFLTQAQMNGGNDISGYSVFACDSNFEKTVEKISDNHQLVVNHFYRDKICGNECELCEYIKASNWKKTEKYIAAHANDRHGLGYLQHQRIKWVLTDRAILASLPSSMGMRILFVTDSGEVETYAGFQVGYVNTNRLLRGLRIRHFRYEKVDTLILKAFLTHTNYSKEYLEHERMRSESMITDTALFQFYGSTVLPIPPDLVLQAAVFDGELRFYQDYKTMPDYMQRAYNYVDTLVAHKKVYLLCIMAMHTSPVIAAYAVKGLEKLNDARCVPFLIQLFQDRNSIYAISAKSVEEQENLHSQLSSTLDVLTGCRTNPEMAPSELAGMYSYSELSIPVWKKKIKLVENEKEVSSK